MKAGSAFPSSVLCSQSPGGLSVVRKGQKAKDSLLETDKKTIQFFIPSFFVIENKEKKDDEDAYSLLVTIRLRVAVVVLCVDGGEKDDE